MKVLIFFALFAATRAAVLLGTGASTQYRSQDNAGNYAFGYNEGHGTGATFRKESGSNGVVAGSYGLADADGRQRIVNYVADAAGFRADIQTNEPGVEPKDPANTSINKAVVVAAPAVTYHAAAAPALAYHGAPLAYHGAPLAYHGGQLAYHGAPSVYAAGHPFGAYGYGAPHIGHGLGPYIF